MSRQWNLVEHGIPPMNVAALLCYEYDSGVAGYTLKHDDETFSEAVGNLPVTHWMVLPEPPVLGGHTDA